MPTSTRPNLSRTTIVLLAVIGVLLLIGLAVGGYVGGWWVREDSTNRRTVIDRQSTAFVTSRIAKARDDVLEVQSLPESGQRAAIVRGICEAVADIPETVTPSDLIQFSTTNCN